MLLIYRAIPACDIYVIPDYSSCDSCVVYDFSICIENLDTFASENEKRIDSIETIDTFMPVFLNCKLIKCIALS